MPPSAKWCKICHPDLPLHEHQDNGSCLVKSANGYVTEFNLMCRMSKREVLALSAADQRLITADASKLFALSKHDAKALKFLKLKLCSAGLVQCGTCLPSCPPLSGNKDLSRKDHSKLPPQRHEN